MNNYLIGDFLIRIKNASLSRNKTVESVSTKIVKNVAVILKKEGFLENLKEEGGKVVCSLSYRRKEPVISGVNLVSKPGLRVYKSAKDLEGKKGPSIFLVSTPLGVLTSREAVKKRVGGEVIAEIW